MLLSFYANFVPPSCNPWYDNAFQTVRYKRRYMGCSNFGMHSPCQIIFAGSNNHNILVRRNVLQGRQFFPFVFLFVAANKHENILNLSL